MIIPVSVIIPCYNCSATIERAINSVINQTVKPFELILIDDFSSDNSIQIIEDIKNNIKTIKIEIIKIKVNQGAASTRNIGWEAATQPYIAFLDSDDSWHPEKLHIQYDYMINNQEIDLCGHLCFFSKNHSQRLNINTKKIKASKIRKISLLFKNPFSTPTVMLKRNIGYRFPTGKRYAEDLALWQALAFSNHCISKIDIKLAYIHKQIYGESGLSSSLYNMEIEELKNINTLLKDKKISALIFLFAIIFSILKFFRRILLNKISFLKPKVI